jgi:hypothetical protein
MFGKQEFGVEYYAKVTDVVTPWDDCEQLFIGALVGSCEKTSQA